MAYIGPIGVAVGQVIQQVVITRDASDFASSPERARTYAHARDILQSDWIIASAVIRQAAVIALGFAFVLIALNAMRVGLLTRFMGVLGIIVGVLFVIPIGSPLPIVQAFWLIALGYLFAGRWPSGVPPAWITGRAEPWPSQQELREQRDGARTPEQQRPAPAAAPATAAAEPAAPAHPSSKKRKRKKRR
jgi:hypothetical protein